MQSWIEDALASVVNPDVVNPERSHFNPEYLPWLTHRFVTFKRDPAVFGRLGSELTRVVVEKYGPDVERFKEKVGENHDLTKEQEAEIYADLNAMGAAWQLLERFQARLEFRQGTIPFPGEQFNPLLPPSPAPMMGPEAELSYEQEAGDPKGATGPETDAGAIKESTEQEETTSGLVEINSDLLELVEHRESFVTALDRARGLLDHVRDPWAVKHITDTAEKLRAIADLLELGHDLEMRGKALRFDGFYKAGQLFDAAPRGRQKNGQIDPLGCFSGTEKKLIGMLRPFEPEDYRRLRDDGIKNGTLSENTFKTPKVPKPQDQTRLDPARFLIDYVVDMRQNLTWYTGLSRAEEFSNDPRLLENLGPVVDQFLDFSITLSTIVRSKYNELKQIRASK